MHRRANYILTLILLNTTRMKVQKYALEQDVPNLNPASRKLISIASERSRKMGQDKVGNQQTICKACRVAWTLKEGLKIYEVFQEEII